MPIARYAITAIAALLLGWVAVVQGLSGAAVRAGNPDAALAIDPGSPSGLSLAADQALAQQDLKGAESLARRAIARFPRDVRALRVLGISLSLQGKAQLGNEVLLKAGALGWRDDATQLWLIRQAMLQRNYATATQRIDAMLRRNQLTGNMMPLMHQVAAIPEGEAAVLDRLADDPPWRRNFFYKMNWLPKADIASHAALVAAMRARNDPISREEMSGFLNYLVNARNYVLARKVWIDGLSADSRARVATVFDGNFEEDPAADTEQPRYPFEWSFSGQGGAFAALGSPPMLIGETALDAQSADGAQTLIARQLIVAGAGHHQVLFHTAVADDLKPEAFEWRVSCAIGESRLSSPPVLGKPVGGSREGVVEFDVPAACGAQWLDLVALGGDVAVEAWFDHVSVR